MQTQILEKPIARGRTAEVYAWGAGQVLKLFYPSESKEAVDYEIGINRVISTKPLPTPKLLDTCTVEGRSGMVFERVEGVSMLQLLLSKPWLVAQLGKKLAQVQTAVLTQHGGGLPSLRTRLAWNIQHAGALPCEIRSRVLAVLDTLPDGDALCHFDLHPDQVMMSPAGPVVIDWTNACQGDPHGDVARTVLLLRMGEPLDSNLLLMLLTHMLRGVFYRGYLRRLLALNPSIKMETIHRWMVPVAAARLNEHIPGEEWKILALLREDLKL